MKRINNLIETTDYTLIKYFLIWKISAFLNKEKYTYQWHVAAYKTRKRDLIIKLLYNRKRPKEWVKCCFCKLKKSEYYYTKNIVCCNECHKIIKNIIN